VHIDKLPKQAREPSNFFHVEEEPIVIGETGTTIQAMTFTANARLLCCRMPGRLQSQIRRDLFGDWGLQFVALASYRLIFSIFRAVLLGR
jgi:hypothetical protein